MVMGLFSKERALKKAVEKILNKHVQSADRMAAMEKLAQDGSDESIFGLCRRFSYACDKTIEDEAEKRWVRETLVAKGEPIIEALRTYMKQAETVAQPLLVLEQLGDPVRALDLVDELLADEAPGYARLPRKRIQLINWLAEWNDIDAPELAKRVTPYLEDFDENVRYAAVDALAQKLDDSAAAPLISALVNEEEESKRLKNRIAEVLAEGRFPVTEQKSEVSELLSTELTGFRLKKDRLEKR